MRGRSKRALTTRVVVGGVVAGALIAAALAGATGLSFLLAYIVGSGLVTFLAYGYDKLQAKRDGRRVTEPALLLLSLLGGALGGWAGMLTWRHKTQHPSFWVAQVVGTLVIAAALWKL